MQSLYAQHSLVKNIDQLQSPIAIILKTFLFLEMQAKNNLLFCFAIINSEFFYRISQINTMQYIETHLIKF